MKFPTLLPSCATPTPSSVLPFHTSYIQIINRIIVIACALRKACLVNVIKYCTWSIIVNHLGEMASGRSTPAWFFSKGVILDLWVPSDTFSKEPCCSTKNSEIYSRVHLFLIFSLICIPKKIPKQEGMYEAHDGTENILTNCPLLPAPALGPPSHWTCRGSPLHHCLAWAKTSGLIKRRYKVFLLHRKFDLPVLEGIFSDKVFRPFLRHNRLHVQYCDHYHIVSVGVSFHNNHP